VQLVVELFDGGEPGEQIGRLLMRGVRRGLVEWR
jgi:hypothetical protein